MINVTCKMNGAMLRNILLWKIVIDLVNAVRIDRVIEKLFVRANWVPEIEKAQELGKVKSSVFVGVHWREQIAELGALGKANLLWNDFVFCQALSRTNVSFFQTSTQQCQWPLTKSSKQTSQHNPTHQSTPTDSVWAQKREKNWLNFNAYAIIIIETSNVTMESRALSWLKVRISAPSTS